MDTHAQVHIITNASMAADVTSLIMGVNLYSDYSVSATYTTLGTLGGTFAIQASVDHRVDPEGNVTNAGTFVTIPDSSVTITGAGTWVWNVQTVGYSFFKLIYTHFSGDTGTLNAFATIKGA